MMSVKMDHTEFMVLVLQLDDVYREPILGFASQTVLAGERIVLVALVSVCEKTPFFRACSGRFFRNLTPEPPLVLTNVFSRSPGVPGPGGLALHGDVAVDSWQRFPSGFSFLQMAPAATPRS